MSVHLLRPKASGASHAQNGGTGIANGGGPPYDGDMDKRVEKLEALAEKTADRLNSISQTVAVITSTSSTKTDLAPVTQDVAIIKSNYVIKSDLTGISQDLAVIKGNYATDTKIAEMETKMIRWFIASFLGICGVIFAALRYMK